MLRHTLVISSRGCGKPQEIGAGARQGHCCLMAKPKIPLWPVAFNHGEGQGGGLLWALYHSPTEWDRDCPSPAFTSHVETHHCPVETTNKSP